ncbi:YlbF family regulator [Calidifontibacillus erzurumensis]|uniref:YlbF family regulator n=1 Tax=Calidifontibacillus erzurumensis TaxID=2741433 RepID=A0A8J8KAF6_9BACI|nr:YlbF family regulator [Calidifontibacillus erzurumensis]NSL50754.1 YlbF family regulator [Calidifontibacillus erzurumensis]
MLVTEERVNILNVADELSMMILQSDVVEEYYQRLYKLRNDEKAIRLIKKFVKQKEKYEEVHRFGKYHPDYFKVIKETRELKRQVDLLESVYEFKKAENALQSLLDEISVLIGHAVSPHIKVPTGNPYFESSSGCGGCSGNHGCSS